jgi:radical SAM family uncharacterized protein/radical SAM-linked protein
MSHALHTHPYASFVHTVEKPARYLGGEYNQIVKDPGSVRASLCLAFPDVYDIGMSHLGTKILYKLVNDEEDLACERAFAPWPDMEAALRERGLPVLSLENRRPLCEFDAVGFSLQYELTYTNVLTLLELGQIPLRSSQRHDSDPVVLAGGPVATQPEPMAPFIDAFMIGDAEQQLPVVLRAIAEARSSGVARRDLLVQLARIEGLYVPSLYETEIDPRSGFEVVTRPREAGIPRRPRRLIVENLDEFPFPDDSPVAAAEAVFDRLSVEIARGCTEGCRFCQAGMIYRPVRERDPEQIIETVLRAVEKNGFDEASLTTLSTADYSCISPLMSELMKELQSRKVSLSVASLRAYGLPETTLDEMSSYRAQGLTFAPEAGTQRMRDVINKNVTEDDIATTAHRVFERGWKRMKLYFMIGLPTEEDDDVRGIMKMGRRMKDIGFSYHGRAAGITVSVSSHVPKPHTPFQWVAMDSLEEIERKQDLLQGLARQWRLEFRRHDPRTSFLEGILGRGDRRVAEVIERAWRKGCRFDGWDEQLDWSAWLDAIEESGIDPRLYLGTIALDARTPWDHLDMQLEDRFLQTDYKRAMKDRLSPPCGKPAGAQIHPQDLQEHDTETRKLVCYHCGVACDMDQMRVERREFLEKLGATSPADGAEARERRMAKQDRIARGEAPHDLRQGEPVRVRMLLSKTGADAMTGHLDLMRKIPRIFRRGGIEIYYSEGYHPKPSLSFGPALPLGVESAGELFEVRLVGNLDDPAALLKKLNRVSEPGLEFVACRIVDEGEPRLAAMLDQADYLVKLAGHGVDEPTVRRHLDRLAQSESWPLTIRRKKREKTVDLREVVAHLRIAGREDRRAVPDPIAEGLPDLTLALGLRLQSGGQVKPVEVLRAVLEAPSLELPPVDLIRAGFWKRTEAGLRSPLETLMITADS